MAAELLKELRKEVDVDKISHSAEVFKDADFPHTPKIPKFTEIDISWVPAKALFKDSKYSVYERIEINDIEQGLLGDCYFMSPLASLAEFPNRVEKIFITKTPNEAGCYAVKFFIAGVPRTVVVDSFFPVDSKGVPLFAAPKENQIWAMIAEKAWAKLHGAWEKIEGGDPREAFAALTGAPAEMVVHQKIPRKEMWDTLLSADRQNYIMASGGAKEKLGLVGGQCYSLVKVVQLETSKGKFERLVQLRNPWGSHEWQGDWGDQSPHWTAKMRKQLFHVPGDDGTFFMKFEDFCYYFSYTFICKYVNHYTHSFLETEGKSACALLTVPANTKGFISVHQLSKRLGQKIDKDYKIGVLLLEVYKYGEGKLIRVASQRSNPLGSSNIELNLTPGVYVLKGEYEVFVPTHPVINFVVYADKSLKIVDLNQPIVEKLNCEVLKEEALKCLPKGFPAQRIAPRKTIRLQANLCAQGHKLVFVEENESAKKVRCDNCLKIKDMTSGEWKCAECNYDMCLECKKNFENALAMQEGKLKLCPNKHVLEPTISAEEGLFVCDFCGSFGELSGTARWICPEKCNIVVCENCLAVPEEILKKKKESKSPQEWKMCPFGHKLVFSKTMYYGDTYECIACSRFGECHYGRWSCSVCSYDLCLLCKSSPDKISEEDFKKMIPFYKTGKTICQKGHTLHFSTMEIGETEMFSCIKCAKQWNRKDGRWFCLHCQYEVCASCRAPTKEINPHAPHCPGGHEMEKTDIGYAEATLFRCDKCQKTFKTEAGRVTCLACGYDTCTKCGIETAWCDDEHHTFEKVGDPASEDKYPCDNCGEDKVVKDGKYECTKCHKTVCQTCVGH